MTDTFGWIDYQLGNYERAFTRHRLPRAGTAEAGVGDGYWKPLNREGRRARAAEKEEEPQITQMRKNRCLSPAMRPRGRRSIVRKA
jgi:hypothetical protein